MTTPNLRERALAIYFHLFYFQNCDLKFEELDNVHQTQVKKIESALRAERERTVKECLGTVDVDDRQIQALEDPAVRAICEHFGYGAVMDSAARQWRKKDSIGALTVGPCVGIVKSLLNREGE